MECIVSVSVHDLKEWRLPASLCFTVILADFVVICYVGLPVVSLLNMHMCVPYRLKICQHK